MTVMHDRQKNTPASQTPRNELVTKLAKTKRPEIGNKKRALKRRSQRNQKESPSQASIVVRPELEQMFLFFPPFFCSWEETKAGCRQNN